MATRGVDSCDGVHCSGVFPGLLGSLFVVLGCFLAVYLSECLLSVERLRKREEVLCLEFEVVEVLLLCNVETILAVQELYHATVGVAHRGIVFDLEAFHALDDTSLQVTGT